MTSVLSPPEAPLPHPWEVAVRGDRLLGSWRGGIPSVPGLPENQTTPNLQTRTEAMRGYRRSNPDSEPRARPRGRVPSAAGFAGGLSGLTSPGPGGSGFPVSVSCLAGLPAAGWRKHSDSLF